MRRCVCRFLCSVLFLWLIQVLCGCDATKAALLSDLATSFEGQSSVLSSISYTASFDAVINGKEYTGLEHSCLAEAQVDLKTGDCYISGEMTARQQDGSSAVSQLECYGDSTGSYYRYGDRYGASQDTNSFLSMVQLPLALHLDQGYTAQAATEILFGAPCTEYTGTEIADGSTQRLLLGPNSASDFSLEGCLVEVSLLIYQGTGLPACVRLNYSNLSELNVTFSDDQDNRFTLTELSYQICYESYGAQVSAQVPEDFRQQALAGSLTLADSFGAVTETTDPDAQEASSPTQQESGATEAQDCYSLSDSAGSYRYEISTPEFMALDQQSDSSVSFYYYYGPDDFELISYTLSEGYTQEEELTYAQSLPDFYRELEGVSDVSFDGIQSLTLDGQQVWYSTVQLTLEQDGQTYEVLDLYSWMEAPGGQDCLEVCITEYNGSGDGAMIDPEEELEYAYGAVQCHSESE